MRILAVTLGVLCFCSMARADVIRADVRSDTLTSFGNFTAVYDPTALTTANAVYFEMNGDHNWGIVARDTTPIGWLDVQAQQWDLTIDGIGYMGLSGGGGVQGLELIENGVRLVNDGEQSFVAYVDPSSGGRTIDVDWENVTVAVPEPAAAVLAVLAALLLALSIRINHEATRANRR